jgi:hypothetical protein
MQHIRLSAYVLSLLLCASTLSAVSSTAQTPKPQGTYALDDATASANVTKAINEAVEPLGFIKKRLARERLMKDIHPYQRIEIRFNGTEVKVATDQWPEIKTPADGRPVVVTRPADKEKFSVSTVWEDAKLNQTFTGEDGRQVNIYSLNADGKTLTVQVEVTSKRLTDLLLKYQLVYKQTTPPSHAATQAGIRRRH